MFLWPCFFGVFCMPIGALGVFFCSSRSLLYTLACIPCRVASTLFPLLEKTTGLRMKHMSISPRTGSTGNGNASDASEATTLAAAGNATARLLGKRHAGLPRRGTAPRKLEDVNHYDPAQVPTINSSTNHSRAPSSRSHPRTVATRPVPFAQEPPLHRCDTPAATEGTFLQCHRDSWSSRGSTLLPACGHAVLPPRC